MPTADPIPLLRQFLVSELLGGDAAPPLEPDTNLLVEGGLDSMGVVRLTAFIEQQFRIPVPAEDVTFENFETLRAIAHYVTRRQTAA